MVNKVKVWMGGARGGRGDGLVGCQAVAWESVTVGGVHVMEWEGATAGGAHGTTAARTE